MLAKGHLDFILHVPYNYAFVCMHFDRVAATVYPY